MTNGRILICFAHPDEESIELGAAIARWVDEGIEVYLICATNGDIGTVPKNMKSQYSSVADLRLSELDCAAKVLGLKQVFKFGYRDSGLKLDETSQHPDSLWSQWQHHTGRVTHDVVDVMRQVRPHVVITFNQHGNDNHPDQVAIHQATVEAFKLVSDPNYQVDELAPYKPQKLYSIVYPSKLAAWIQILRTRIKRQNPHQTGRNRDIDLVEIYNHIEPTHTRFSVVDYFDIWERAIQCHESQVGQFVRKPTLWRRIVFGKQELTRIYPVPSRDRVDEDSVFAGVTID